MFKGVRAVVREPSFKADLDGKTEALRIAPETFEPVGANAYAERSGSDPPRGNRSRDVYRATRTQPGAKYHTYT